MAAASAATQVAHAASSAQQATRSMRTGVLIHPSTAHSGRFLVLPHPRTLVPTYYLSASSSTSSSISTDQLYELSTLQDSKHDRSWMISRLNQVISSGQLDILSRIDARFLVVSLLYSVLGDGKYRSREDMFEQIALELHVRRSEELCEAIPELKARLATGKDSAEGQQNEWTDVVVFEKLEVTKRALEDVADVQGSFRCVSVR